jgi:hypothetical protein
VIRYPPLSEKTPREIQKYRENTRHTAYYDYNEEYLRSIVTPCERLCDIDGDSVRTTCLRHFISEAGGAVVAPIYIGDTEAVSMAIQSIFTERDRRDRRLVHSISTNETAIAKGAGGLVGRGLDNEGVATTQASLRCKRRSLGIVSNGNLMSH